MTSSDVMRSANGSVAPGKRRRRSGAAATDERKRESGYVLAQTVLLMVPLLLFAAFATDVGSWYLHSQKMQRGADAASLAGVALLPDFTEAERVARETALLNGYTDATPGDNSDFETGPAPQIRVTAPNSHSLEVEIRRTEDVYFAKLVMNDITLTRFSVSQFVRPVHMGNPTSGLGTGTIDPTALGQPNDKMWLSVNAYCTDHEHGDQFLSGFFDGTTFQDNTACGPAPGVMTHGGQPNPTFDSDAYVFVAEYAPSSPALDIDIYEPGVGCPGSITDDGGKFGPGTPLHYEVHGPSLTTDHETYLASSTPIASGMLPLTACIGNSPDGDGWWPLAAGLSPTGANGGYYFVRISNRNPDTDATAAYWADFGLNNFSLRATRSGQTTLCTFSTADPTCPQLYPLRYLPLYRDISGPSEFYLARIPETHAGEKLLVTFFDAAEDVDNIQFADSNGKAMPFEWRYVDGSVGKMPLGFPPYSETSFAPSGTTCTWATSTSEPCLDASARADFNDRFIQIAIKIPDDYTCGADCWWRLRYTTGGNPTDRSSWSIRLLGDPIRLVE